MSTESAPNKKVVQSAATRAQLLRVAGDLFAERGYAGAALDDIASKAGLTKGALYHHFRDKRALFDAVVIATLEEEIQRVSRESRRQTAETHKNSWERLIALTYLFLDGFRNDRLRRIVWVEAPAALGNERWQRVVSDRIQEQLRWIAGQFAKQGLVEERFREPIAEILFGAVHAAGMAIGRADDQDAKRDEMAPALRWMLEELFNRPGRRRS